MSSLFEPMKYEEWLEENPDVVDLTEECSECDGIGDVLCECCHEGWVDCERCDGTGIIKSARQLYEEQRKRDLKKLAMLQKPSSGG